MKDMNVLGAMQLFAVCQKSPTVRKVVLRSSRRSLRVQRQGPGEVHGRDECAPPPAAAASPGTASKSRATLRGLGRRRPRHRDVDPATCPADRPQLHGAVSRYSDLAAWCPPCSAVTRGCSCCTRRTRSPRSNAPPSPVAAGTYNIAGDGVVMMSQAIRRAGRRRGADAATRCSAPSGSALMGSSMRSFTEGATRLLPVRLWSRHHADAQPNWASSRVGRRCRRSTTSSGRRHRAGHPGRLDRRAKSDVVQSRACVTVLT